MTSCTPSLRTPPSALRHPHSTSSGSPMWKSTQACRDQRTSLRIGPINTHSKEMSSKALPLSTRIREDERPGGSNSQPRASPAMGNSRSQRPSEHKLCGRKKRTLEWRCLVQVHEEELAYGGRLCGKGLLGRPLCLLSHNLSPGPDEASPPLCSLPIEALPH